MRQDMNARNQQQNIKTDKDNAKRSYLFLCAQKSEVRRLRQSGWLECRNDSEITDSVFAFLE